MSTVTPTPTPCRTGDPEAWFTLRGWGQAARAEAAALCKPCPKLDRCLEAAAEFEAGVPRDHRFGVWGGLLPVDRWRAEQAAGKNPPEPATEPQAPTPPGQRRHGHL